MDSMLSKAGVDALVPHRGTMSWLDQIVSADSEGVVAQAQIRPTSLFVRNGQLPVWVGIEYMAQTVAAWAGQRASQHGRKVAIGFLVGTRRYDVFRQAFKVGECLRIEARCEMVGENGLGMFACQIFVDGDVAASANLAVFEPPEGAAFLQSSENKQ